MPETAVSENPGCVIEINQIKQLIPHRYPMLLVDRVTHVVPRESAIGVKNVTINEPFFPGHFPQRPVMPGVLIIEAMAQTAAILVMHSLDSQSEGELVYFMSITDARFRKPVGPGDTLKMHVEKQQQRGNVWRFCGKAYVDGILHAEAIYTAMIAE
jgi:3-hydroxyacyl-[acyl-carrier-protein] dehydratase